MRIIYTLLLTLLLIFGVSAQSTEDTLLDLINDNRSLSGFAELIVNTEIADILGDPDNSITLFVPSNRALKLALEGDFGALVAADAELLDHILMYHIVDGLAISQDALMRLDSAPTMLEDSEIAIEVVDDTVILNGSVETSDRTFEAGNGFIHLISDVLLPPEMNAAGGACTVQAETEDTARIRVGPGENRTAVAFLPVGTPFEVLGQNIDESGNVWFSMDKDAVAPGSAINEAWVLASEVTASDGCASVAESDAPPVIPITNQTSTSTEGDDTSGNAAAGTFDISIPSTVRWFDSGVAVSAGQSITIRASGTANTCATCEGEFASLNTFRSPDGAVGNNCNLPDCTTGSAPWGALLMRISGGAPMLVGSGGSFTASGAGTLQFGINDAGHFDNAGVLNVSITVQ